MTSSAVPRWPAAVVYPESDGEPMAEGDTQGDAIRLLVAGYRFLYRDEPDVHVSGDLFWYPVEGNPRVVIAPDVMVIDGCPRDIKLRTYLPWEHAGLPPRLAVEVLSPTNTVTQMLDKLAFYDRHRVSEYIFVDPFDHQVRAWLREGDALVPQLVPDRWTSPTTGVTLGFENGEFVVTGPDDRRWLVPEEELARAEAEAARAEAEAARAEAEAARATAEAARATAETVRADRAEAEAQRLAAELAELRGRT